MSTFSLAQDWKFIAWKDTLITNLFRSVATGIAWMILGFVVGSAQESPWIALTLPLTFPFLYFVFFLPIGLVAAQLSRMGVPWIGLASILVGLFIVPGDPIFWIFDKITKEQFVPIKDLSFITFAVVLFVVDEERKAAATESVQTYSDGKIEKRL